MLPRFYKIITVWVLFECVSQGNALSSLTVLEDRSQDFTTKELPETQKLPSGGDVEEVDSTIPERDEAHDIRRKNRIEDERFDDDGDDEFIDERSEPEENKPVVEIDDAFGQSSGDESPDILGSGQTVQSYSIQDKPEANAASGAGIEQPTDKSEKNNIPVKKQEEDEEEGGSGGLGSGDGKQDVEYVRNSIANQSAKITDEHLVREVDTKMKTNSTNIKGNLHDGASSVLNGTVNGNDKQQASEGQSVSESVNKSEADQEPLLIDDALKDEGLELSVKENSQAKFSKPSVSASFSAVKEVTDASGNKQAVSEPINSEDQEPLMIDAGALEDRGSGFSQNRATHSQNSTAKFSKSPVSVSSPAVEQVNDASVNQLKENTSENASGKRLLEEKLSSETKKGGEEIVAKHKTGQANSYLDKLTTQPVKPETKTKSHPNTNFKSQAIRSGTKFNANLKQDQQDSENISAHQTAAQTREQTNTAGSRGFVGKKDRSEKEKMKTHQKDKKVSSVHGEKKAHLNQHKIKTKISAENESKIVKISHHGQNVSAKDTPRVRPKNMSTVKQLLTQKLRGKTMKAAQNIVNAIEPANQLQYRDKAKATKKHHECQLDDVKRGHSLRGGTSAGHFEMLGKVSEMSECINRCCGRSACDVALLLEERCFGVACYSAELCEPIPLPHPDYVTTRLAYINKGQKRSQVSYKELQCTYGNRTLNHNEKWSGKLCGAVVTCRNGISMVTKCPGIPPRPRNCANPRLVVQKRNGECCKMHWKCTGNNCKYGDLSIKHGYSFSDQLCTGVVSCNNGHLSAKYCPKIPSKPPHCANPRLKVVKMPGKCCKKHWDCSDKSCKYNNKKIKHGDRLTDDTCSTVLECNHGYLSTNSCSGPPRVPRGCINPALKIERIPGKCCKMQWTCAVR